MPTGYTADLTTDSQFKDFALSVARGFGALIHMRDEPFDAPLTLPEASDYHAKALAKAEAKLAKLQALTPEQAESAAAAEYEEELGHEQQSRTRAQTKRDAYRHMLAKVEAWQAPTPDHEGLKEDMIRQLTESDKWDCGQLDRPLRVQRLAGTEWLTESIRVAQKDIKYHKEGLADEVQRTNERRQWVIALQNSLPA